MRYLAALLPCALLLAACSAQTNTVAAVAAPTPAGTVARPPVPFDQADAEDAVRQTVTLLGAQLKNESRLAPPQSLRQQLRASYTNLVTPRLLQKWLATPTQTPGRDVSSPWPDSIAVDTVDCADADHCKVRGEVRYVTSNEVEHGGTADTRSIRLDVDRTADGWRIDAVQM
jgi:hypothetical protein